MARGARRAFVAFVVVAAVVVGLAIGGRALWRAAQSVVKSDGCDFGSYQMSLSRSENAATMVSVVVKRHLPERAAVLVLGAALQESKLDNIPEGSGDRDSVGVLQQRPSQGWGSAEQLSDIHYATGKFLDAMLKVPHWQTDSLAAVVQTVQVSADGSAYARHEPEAQAIADALTGAVAAGVSCDFDKPTVVAAPTTIATQLLKDLPVSAPSISGKTLTVPGASWATASWLVTHANTYGIAAVAHNGRIWHRSKGWTADAKVPASGVTATLAG